jgi:hypothetical protein
VPAALYPEVDSCYSVLLEFLKVLGMDVVPEVSYVKHDIAKSQVVITLHIVCLSQLHCEVGQRDSV